MSNNYISLEYESAMDEYNKKLADDHYNKYGEDFVLKEDTEDLLSHRVEENDSILNIRGSMSLLEIDIIYVSENISLTAYMLSYLKHILDRPVLNDYTHMAE